MRVPIAFALIFLLTACIPGGDRRTPPPRPTQQSQPAPPRAAADDPAIRQCHVDLARAQVRFRPLEDRRFDRGCSALGSVQLLEIGTPVTNLGAMTCPLARVFARWVRESVQPLASHFLGSPVRRVETFGTYACRGVNGRSGARLSEHGYANAVDVAAFLLADGRRVTVEQGWHGEEENVRQFLRAIHQGGCRLFNIGLDPDSDSYHYNHLHFDMGRGPYCR